MHSFSVRCWLGISLNGWLDLGCFPINTNLSLRSLMVYLLATQGKELSVKRTVNRVQHLFFCLVSSKLGFYEFISVLKTSAGLFVFARV